MPIVTTEVRAMAPAANNSHEEEIRYAIGRCSLGTLLIAATENGVCSILLGNDSREVLQDLSSRFPKANLRESNAELSNPLQAIAGFIDSPTKLPVTNLSFDLHGTAFQQTVWKELQRIPSGQTISYAELAERIGNPGAVRAVATACASNPLAVLIPCHRVIGSDGRLAGYRWGLERKQSLLRMERHNG